MRGLCGGEYSEEKDVVGGGRDERREDASKVGRLGGC
jgi:hypothetical protein